MSASPSAVLPVQDAAAALVALAAVPPPQHPIVLCAVSHPALGDIGIDDALFAVGRTEPPFDRYPADAVADLSRRHARIFSEAGIAHVADLGSKNGTAVNAQDIRQKTARLADGDEICFGRHLRYRVRLQATVAPPALRLLSLTLTPEPGPVSELGPGSGSGPGPGPEPGSGPDAAESRLDQIVVHTFPFLVSKTDATFSRYRQQHAQQLNYLSRRHAHVFLRRGRPFIEDLGSTNGTFVNGRRLDEHAALLADGDLLAFGGLHFIYRVQLQQEQAQPDPTLTCFSGGAGNAAAPDGARAPGPAESTAAAASTGPTGRDSPAPAAPQDRTTFIVAADSFLDIFCFDAPAADDRAAEQDAAADVPGRPDAGMGMGGAEDARTPDGATAKNAAGEGKAACLARVFSGKWRRVGFLGVACALCLGLGAVAWHAAGAPQRHLQELVKAGRLEAAATLTATWLHADPAGADVRTAATDTWLKAYLPPWMTALRARRRRDVDLALAALRQHAEGNPAAQTLLAELVLVGWLERTVAPVGSGSPSVAGGGSGGRPIRLFIDEDGIEALLAEWERDPVGHQWRAAGITAAVPAFGPVFASALSDLRRLQSDSAVLLGASTRLKAGVRDALAKDHPETIAALIDATAEKTPRLTGLEILHADLFRFLQLERSVRDGRLGPIARTMQAGFATPPFRERVTELIRNGRLPPPVVTDAMHASAAAWSAGDIARARTLLAQIGAVPWVQAAGSEAAHRQALLTAFDAREAAATAAASKAIASKAIASKAIASKAISTDTAVSLAALAGLLDGQADAFLWRRLQTHPAFVRSRVQAEALAQAETAARRWQQYRDAGGVDPADLALQSLASGTRRQVALLAGAEASGRRAERVTALAGDTSTPEAVRVSEAVTRERARLQGALRTIDPGLSADILQARVALLDGHPDSDLGALLTEPAGERRAAGPAAGLPTRGVLPQAR